MQGRKGTGVGLSGGALGWLSPPRFRPPFPQLLAHKALTFVDPFGKIDNGDPPPYHSDQPSHLEPKLLLPLVST